MGTTLFRTVLMLGWIPALLVAGGVRGTPWGTAEAQSPTPVKVTRIFTGPDGKTHVDEFDVAMQPRDAGSDLSASLDLTSMRVRRTTPKYFLDWHPAPRRQLVVTLKGESEIELADGRKIRLGPGHILLAEDTTGQGHISRAVGSGDRIALDIGLADGATFPR